MNIRTVLAATLLAGVAFSAQAQTLRVGLQEDPDVLDPHRARTFVGRIVFTSICDKLVDVTPDLKIVPQLATEWTFSDDGKLLTMKLRPGVKMHDGEPMNADAVKFSLDRARSLQDSMRKSEVASIESVEVADPLTVLIRLARPDATLLAQLTDRAGMILSPKAGNDFAGKPVCAGPYKFVDRVQNNRITVERFDEYWNKSAYNFQRVVYQIIPDTTVRLANLKAGDLDILERLAPTDYKSATSDARLKVVTEASLGYQAMTVNTTNGEKANAPLGKDKRVRQALSLSLDREIISQVVFDGLYPPNDQPFPSVSPYFDKARKLEKRDIAKAKALLKAAGAEKVTIEMHVANNPVDMRTGEVIQAMAAEAGITITIKASEFATQLKEQQQGQFQLSRIGWSGRIDPDGNIHQFLTCKGGLNDGKYCNEAVDKALNDARVTYDPAKRKALYDAAQAILQDELPIIYLYNQPGLWAMSKKLDGFVAYPDSMIRLQGVKLAP